MIEIRKFSGLGAANHGWLDARHHFSFASYHDPSRMGWGSIRVWNDDTIAAGQGFAPHGHQDMEIITYVRSGAVTHRDSMGNEGRTSAGDVQVMSAGTGVQHSEYNLEDTATTLFQIWIIPDQPGGQPAWDAKPFPKDHRAGQWSVLANDDPDSDALPIRADARVLGATLKAGETLDLTLDAARHAYLVPAIGRISIGGQEAEARDGIAITDEPAITITALEDCELVLVDAR